MAVTSGHRSAAGTQRGDRSRGEPGPASDGQAEGPAPADSDAGLTTKAKAICLGLLAIAPRPRAGLAQALRRREIPDHVIEGVLDRLTEVGLIDDAEYAASFVRTKHRDRGLARTALRGELRRLGLDDDLTAVAVSAVDGVAEESRARALVSKRVASMTAIGPAAARRRLLAVLARRGYPFDTANSVVEEVVNAHFASLQ